MKHFRRHLRIIIAASLGGAALSRLPTLKKSSRTAESGQAATPKTIAQLLLHQDLAQDDLFEAMWDWQHRTGIEPLDIYQEYKKLRPHHGEEHPNT